METQKKRIDYLDLAKGIGILLVVWAHARGPYSSYMYKCICHSFSSYQVYCIVPANH